MEMEETGFDEAVGGENTINRHKHQLNLMIAIEKDQSICTLGTLITTTTENAARMLSLCFNLHTVENHEFTPQTMIT